MESTNSLRPAQCAIVQEPEKTLSEYEFRLLRDHVHDYCGIYFDDTKVQTLASRMSFRLKLLGMASFTEYYNHLKFNPRAKEEMESLIPHLTNNETYFFREMHQLLFLVSEIGELIRKKGANGRRNTINIVSCGCSSGEEAFTLGLLMEEAGLYRLGWDIRITGVDIDGKVLEKANSGKYTSYSMRATDEEMMKTYFLREGERYTLDGKIRDRVSFRRINLMDRDALLELKHADAVLCRNVFIYFSDDAMRRIVETFHEMLRSDGCLLLGHSESLARITEIFHPERHPNLIVYRKRGPRT